MKLSELFEQNGFDLRNLKESFDFIDGISKHITAKSCLLYTSPSPRDYGTSRMPSSA